MRPEGLGKRLFTDAAANRCQRGPAWVLRKDIQQGFIIQNKLGIHLRVANLIAETASRFSADIRLSKDGVEVNAKSIVGITLLTASCGSELMIKARGIDSSQAVEELGRLIESKFGEE